MNGSETPRTKLEWALQHAADGFFVFPLKPNSKKPAITGWQDAATRNQTQIEKWWRQNPDYNIGIYTGKFGDDGGALLVVDVDVKKGKNGHHTLLGLELEEKGLPRTRTNGTANGGQHIIFFVEAAVRQGVNVLGPSLDIRSRGGYIAAPGSLIDGKAYTVLNNAPITPTPQWIVDDCGPGSERTVQRIGHAPVVPIDQDAATLRALRYLTHEAPLAIEGQGGDQTTFAVAAKVKDLGVLQHAAVELIASAWNDRCAPPWSLDELSVKVKNAYAYGHNPVGVDAPEVVFAEPYALTPEERKVSPPITGLNAEFALIEGSGAHVIHETTDSQNRYQVQHLTIAEFHLMLKPKMESVGKTQRQVSELWLASKERRAYKGLIFEPGRNDSEGPYFNLWRGFAVAPAPVGATHVALALFLEHLRENVCGGKESLYRWLLGYFAHLIQRPGEKSRVALVLRGGKGTGKNACIERVGHLLGRHFLLTSNRRYLLGNFNGHLEHCLMFVLDEAFWSGDKQAEGTLKDLITGREHVIEHKGKEPYAVANKTRVVILSNEDWVVPASHDERRFAFFDVGDGRKQDQAFFGRMIEGMEQGGYAALMRYLMDYDISGVDVNAAPKTAGLLSQKIESADPLRQFWYSCLRAGHIAGLDFDGGWPTSEGEPSKPVECKAIQDAFRNHLTARNIRTRVPLEGSIGRTMKPLGLVIRRKRVGKSLVYAYDVPSLSECRAKWDVIMGQPTVWESEA